MLKVKKKAKGNFIGVMALFTKEIYLIITFMATGCTPGSMAGNIMDNGEIIKCMGKVYSNGEMEGSTMGNTKAIKNMDKGLSIGRMGVFM